MDTERADQRLRRRLIVDMWACGGRNATGHWLKLAVANGRPKPFSPVCDNGLAYVTAATYDECIIGHNNQNAGAGG